MFILTFAVTCTCLIIKHCTKDYGSCSSLMQYNESTLHNVVLHVNNHYQT